MKIYFTSRYDYLISYLMGWYLVTTCSTKTKLNSQFSTLFAVITSLLLSEKIAIPANKLK